MRQAAELPRLLLRLVQAHVQQRQKGHVIAQGEPGEIARFSMDGAADAAVHRAVALLLVTVQLLPVCIYKSEHDDFSIVIDMSTVGADRIRPQLTKLSGLLSGKSHL